MINRNRRVFSRRWIIAGVIAIFFASLGTYLVSATYGHPIVPFNPNPVRIAFPRAGRVVIWNDVRSSNPGYFARYYFIRSGCQVGVNCGYADVINNQTVLTTINVSAGETVGIKACDCYGGNCGAGGCQYPHVGWKTPHHNFFCPNYFTTNVYDPTKGGKDFTALWNAFAASGDTLVAGPQCWGDWDEDNSNGGYDHDFEDFLLIFAYRDTFTGYHDGNSGDVSSANCRASGWAKQNELTNKDIYVRVLSDGSPVVAGWANLYRGDLTAQCSGGTCAFSFNLSGLISTDVTYTIRVQGQNPYTGTWFDLTGTAKRLRCLAPPNVDLHVDGGNGPITKTAPASYSLSWTASGIGTTCTASGSWSGAKALTGNQAISGVGSGTHTYTLTCSNGQGAASDSVTVNVLSPPTVDLKIDNQNGPITRVSLAGYTLAWSSQNATACSASSTDSSWSGSVPVSGTKAFSGMGAGTCTYTITCTNASGSATDSVTAVIVAPLGGSISALYAKLLLFAPVVEQPAQTLTGIASGGEPPYQVTIHVRSPSGVESIFSKSGSNWTLDPNNSGDANLGVTEQGVWTAWATLQDSAGRTYTTSSVIWEVAWYPVHGRP